MVLVTFIFNHTYKSQWFFVIGIRADLVSMLLRCVSMPQHFNVLSAIIYLMVSISLHCSCMYFPCSSMHQHFNVSSAIHHVCGRHFVVLLVRRHVCDLSAIVPVIYQQCFTLRSSFTCQQFSGYCQHFVTIYGWCNLLIVHGAQCEIANLSIRAKSRTHILRSCLFTTQGATAKNTIPMYLTATKSKKKRTDVPKANIVSVMWESAQIGLLAFIHDTMAIAWPKYIFR